MKTDLGKPQYLEYLTYLDCKKRTKKQVGLCDKDKNDEVLVRTILANSSIVEHENERSYSRVYDAVDLICKQLCPGQWCTRSHCQHYSSSSAWNCANMGHRTKLRIWLTRFMSDTPPCEKGL